MKKKPKTIQFQISEPCSENWNKMHSLPGGKFCDNCEKTVVDFTEMTDNELVRFFEKNNQKLCGRFRSDQLNKDIEIPRTPSSFQKWKSVAAIAAGLLTWNSVYSQTLLPQENISTVKRTKAQKGGKCLLKKTTTKFLKKKLQGIVKDQNGEELIGVNILLTERKGTTTDIDGSFELEIPSDWESFEITFSYIGYETQIIEFDVKDILEGKNAEVKMLEANNILKGIEVIAKNNNEGCILLGGVAWTTVEKVSLENVKKEKAILPISSVYPNPFFFLCKCHLKLRRRSTLSFSFV